MFVLGDGRVKNRFEAGILARAVVGVAVEVVVSWIYVGGWESSGSMGIKEFVIQSGKEKFARKKWGAGDFR